MATVAQGSSGKPESFLPFQSLQFCPLSKEGNNQDCPRGFVNGLTNLSWGGLISPHPNTSHPFYSQTFMVNPTWTKLLPQLGRELVV